MAVERTFSMIKPDATKRNLTGKIIAKLEEAGLRVIAQKRVWMSRRQAEGFYAVHKGRPFFDELCAFMSSGPTVVQVLEGENAILRNREVMGATDPAKAAEGTIRKEFATSDRRELRARLRRSGDGGAGDRLLVRRDRDRRLKASPRSGRRSALLPAVGGGVVRALRRDPAAVGAGGACSFFQKGACVLRKSMRKPAAPKAASRCAEAVATSTMF